MIIPAITVAGTLTETPADQLQQPTRVTYQRTAPGHGNLIGNGTYNHQRRACVIPLDPKTPAQIARRANMRAAVVAWQAATPEQRDVWRTIATARRVTPYNAFVSSYLKSHTPPVTTWDYGGTTWDGGLTTWDNP
jgi:hypothetical protein